MEYREPIPALPAGTAFGRLVAALVRNRGIVHLAAQQIESNRIRYERTPELIYDMRVAVSAQSTTNSTGLVLTGSTIRNFIPLLKEVSVVDQLLPRSFRVPFLSKVPFQTVNNSANWIAQGHPTPVVAQTFSSVTLPHTKFGLISVITQELANQATPGGEGTIVQILRNSVGYATDRLFLDSSISAVADQNPGAVTAGAVVVVSTGSTSAAIATDLSTMTTVLAQPWGSDSVVFIMRPSTLQYLAMHNDGNWLKQAADGRFYVGAVPIYTSSASPQQIALIDFSKIAIATKEDSLEVDISNEAGLEMTDTPHEQGDSSPISDLTNYRSLWQDNEVGVKVLRWISWQRCQSGSVVYMATSY